ncbi:unnamed protein product [Nezara viridula]|uniref:Lipase maturation factor n=1 Tax=Nezara viridula TaxID=85310 RepID=A0A9P0HPM0_NEZVI|nr:unnamed protein product [Nezara viridula]
MAEIRYTRNLFLRFICAIYLFAFASLYVQIPGLYGNNGILPARTQMDVKETEFAAKLQKKPTLLWFAPYLGLDTEYMMDVLALIGMLFSFTGFFSQKFCSKSTFTALWSLYYSLYQVGQTFMWFQWDILLLETGFLCILIAPLRHKATRSAKKQQPGSPRDHVTFWLVRWLLFRLMFSSGIVKLTSGCPTWWGLSALSVHFESQCIPTPVSWYWHHLPQWLLKLGVVGTYFIEIMLPPFFFFPVRAVRITAFFLQVLLQLAIILTGNYNFFNLLTIALCLSLLDDDCFYKTTKKSGIFMKLFKTAITVGVYLGLIYATVVLYGLKIMPGGVVESKITFSSAQFDSTLGRAIPALVGVALLSLLLASLKALTQACTQPSSGIFSKIASIGSTLFYIFTALFLFADSLVPFSTLHPAGNKTVLPEAREWHDKLSGLHLTNSYGLFRRMTGVGGRPEVIIEGSNALDGPWTEFHFKYKPGEVNRSLPFVVPHQPRLDWQMWFAALGTYHQNPWIMSLAYRILTGQEEVLKLMAPSPFSPKPPKYVRATLYKYHYVPWSSRNSAAYWTREKVGEYFPIFAKDHTPLLDYLKSFKILGQEKKKESVSPLAVNYLNLVRQGFSAIEPPLLMLSLLLSGIAIILASSYIGSGSQHKPVPQQTQQKKQNQRRTKN